MLLRERFEGRIAEPSLQTGFDFAAHDQQTGLASDSGSAPVTICSAANVPCVILEGTHGISEYTTRKEAHLQPLEDEQTDDESETEDTTTCSKRMQRRYEKEERRHSRLVRDRDVPTKCPLKLPTKRKDQPALSDERYMMIGALDPDPVGYLPAEPGAGGLIDEGDYEYDPDFQGQGAAASNPGTQWRRLEARPGAQFDLKLVPKLPENAAAGEHEKQTAAQIFSDFNKRLVPPCWRKRLWPEDIDEDRRDGVKDRAGGKGGANSVSHRPMNGGESRLIDDSGYDGGSEDESDPLPPPAKRDQQSDGQAELALAQSLQYAADEHDQKQATAQH